MSEKFPFAPEEFQYHYKNNTALAPSSEPMYKQWVGDREWNNVDYDNRAMFRNDLQKRGPVDFAFNPTAAAGHWNDIGKKPNHPTFSDQSQYRNQGYPGQWTDTPDGYTFYNPNAIYAHDPRMMQRLAEYFMSPSEANPKSLLANPAGFRKALINAQKKPTLNGPMEIQWAP